MTSNEIEQTVTHLLNQVSGRRTPARESVLNILLSEKCALNHQSIEDIAQQRGLSLDKVTLYRTLDWLVEQGLAHRIASIDRTWYFNALPNFGTAPHAHFHCKRCSRIYCLEHIQATPPSDLPAEYLIEEATLCLEGQCIHCANDPEN